MAIHNIPISIEGTPLPCIAKRKSAARRKMAKMRRDKLLNKALRFSFAAAGVAIGGSLELIALWPAIICTLVLLGATVYYAGRFHENCLYIRRRPAE